MASTSKVDVVAYTETTHGGHHYRVSTVRLFGTEDYETLVFRGKASWRDIDGRRHQTRRAAEKGHRELVKAWSD